MYIDVLLHNGYMYSVPTDKGLYEAFKWLRKGGIKMYLYRERVNGYTWPEYVEHLMYMGYSEEEAEDIANNAFDVEE